MRRAVAETLERRQLFTATPVISEFMASNATTLQSKALNNYPDWIEIHNTDTAATLDLSGWYLTNKPTSSPKKFKVPTGTTIAPNGYMVVFASNQSGSGGYLTATDGTKELHANFNLGASADSVALVQPDGATVVSSYTWVASPAAGQIGPQLTDVSYGIINNAQLIGPHASAETYIPKDNSLGSAWEQAGFNDSSWIAGTTGVGFRSDGTYDSVISTNISNAIKGYADAYVRIPFAVSNPSIVTSLDLNMQMNDGFVAYLNGVEVARKNAPTSVAYNSLATKLSSNGADGLPLSYDFDISAFRSALVSGNNVLAIQGINNRVNGSDFLVNPTLSYTTSTPTTGFITKPTPGAANTAGVTGYVSDIQFDHAAGLYNSPFDLTLSTDTAGATIRYTTDGSAPTLTNGYTYAGAIHVGGGTRSTEIIRAAGFADGMQPTNTFTQSFIFLADVATQSASTLDPTAFPSTWGSATADYSVDPTVSQSAAYGANFVNDLSSIPTVSLVMDPKDLFDATNGIYSNSLQDGDAWKRMGSIEVINPDGSLSFQTDADITMEGGGSRDPNNTPKHSFRLFFDGNGDVPTTLNQALFPDSSISSFNTLILHAVFNNTWVQSNSSEQQRADYVKDQFGHDSFLAMGQPASHGTYMQLYINGVYWGLYNPMERPDAAWAASYYGGNKDDWDVVHDQSLSDGNLTRWNQMFAIADDTTMTADQKFQALKPYVDMKSLSDYMILMQYTGNNDWDTHNWYAGADRTGLANGDATFKFWVWDSERTLEGVNDNELNVNNDLCPSRLFQTLKGSADFRQIFADEVQRNLMNGGALSPAASIARYMSRANQIQSAVIGESARWGDYRKTPAYTQVDWQNEVNRLTSGPTSYFAVRTNNVLAQYRAAGLFNGTTLDAPILSFPAGTVNAGTQLSILTDATTVGTIFYTLDGTDPRAEGGGVAGNAVAYAGPITLNDNAHVKARVMSGGNWSALTDATYLISGRPQLRITEINYHPNAPANSSGYTDDDFQFVELQNIGSTPLSLAGYSISGGIGFTFGNMTLAAGAHTVVVKNLAAFQSLYGTSVNVAGTFTGALSHSDAELKLTGSVGETVLDFYYDDGWYPSTDGDGNTLVINDPNTNVSNYGDAASWHASYDINGTPGTDELPPQSRGVVVSELLSNPGSETPSGDQVELHNTGSVAVNVAGWYLSDSTSNPEQYRINSDGGQVNTTIAAGGYLVLTEGKNFGNAADPGSITQFSFSKNGDGVVLSSATSEGLTGYVDSHDFAGADVNMPFALVTNSDGSTDFTAESASTFGSDNAAPLVGPIVINELMYDPAGSGDEFIELRNTSSNDVSVNGWQFTAGVTFTFPTTQANPTPDNPSPIIAANSYALIIPSTITATAFRTKYGIPANVAIFSGYTGALDNSGEKVELSRPGAVGSDGMAPMIVVDHVHYNPTAPWPAAAHGSGPSLSRVSGTAYGNDPASWAASSSNGGTPGTANFSGNLAPIVSAGTAQTINLPTSVATLHGSVSDDGQPNGTLASTWSVIGGNAANVSFGDATAATTTATFAAAGVYTLQLSATDGSLTTNSTVKITVNTPPVVNAGADQYVPFAQFGNPTTVTLAGSATDTDGLPNPPAGVSTNWSVISSPDQATVTFDDATLTNAKATFSASGTYTLRLTATDGAATVYDDMQVIIDHAPVVSAGTDNFIVAPNTQFTLKGVVTDDGQPTAPGTVPPVTSQWSQIDGPATAVFTDATNPGTVVTLSAVGDYTLRLTATEGSIVTYDDVVISVVTNPIQPKGVTISPTLNTSFTGTVATFAYADSTAQASAFTASIAWGDGVTSAGTIVVDSNGGFDVVGTHTYTSANTQAISVVIGDGTGSNTANSSAVISATAPVVGTISGASLNEGGTYTASAGFTDSSGGPWTATVDYGDGSGAQALTYDANTHVFNLSHVYVDNGSYSVAVTVTNTATTLSGTSGATVAVANVAPTVSITSAGPITAGGTFATTGTFADPGSLDTFTATVNYGDGSATQALSLDAVHHTFTLSHVYANSGSFNVSVVITDKDGGIGNGGTSEVVNPASTGTDPSLVAWYKLDEDAGTLASDSSGNGNNATLVGGPTWATGKIGYGVQLHNASTNHVVAPDSASLEISNAITLAAWVEPAKGKTSQVIVKKAGFGTIDGYEIGLSDNGKMFFRLNQKTSGDTYRVDSTSSYPTDGKTWVNVAATYDGTTMKLYVNGVLQASKAASIKIATNSVGLGIGAQDDGFRPLEGVIDDVRVYNRALSASEVSAIVNPPVTPVETSIAITPTSTSLTNGKTTQFTAIAKDQTGTALASQPTFVWSLGTGSVGSIDPATGLYTAPATGTGSATVIAKDAATGIASNVASVSVTAAPVETTIAVTPTSASVANGATSQFTAIAKDQNGNALATQPTFTWSLGTGSVGSINAATGLYTAPTTGTGTATAIATDAATSITSNAASITVTASTSTDPSLVAWYKLDEDAGTLASDSSGNGNNATLVGGPTWATGKTGSGVQLHNASTNHVVAPDSASLEISNAITLAAWVEPAKGKTSQVIVKKAGFGTIDGYEIGLSDNGKMFFRLNQKTSGDTYRVDSTSSYPTDGKTWVNVAATYDGTTMKLYVNGVLQASKAASIKIATNSVGLGIGAQDDGFRPLEGVIDDVRVYNRALSASEVSAIVNPPVTPVETSIAITPTSTSLTNGKTTQFTAIAKDQTGTALASQPTFVWSLGTGSVGSIDPATGLYTAPTTGTGSATVFAKDATTGLTSSAATVTVTATPVETSIVVTPTSTSVSNNGTTQFTAVAKDQNGNVLASQPTFTWALGTGSVGSINSTTGLYTAPATGTGSATAIAKDSTTGLASNTANVSVVSQSTSGLVAQYTFDDGTANDSIGANNGTLIGGATAVAGRTGPALSFNGSTQYVSVANSASLNPTSAITLSAWVDATDWRGNHRILQKGSKDQQYRLLAENGVLKFDLKNVGTITATLPTTGVWHLITATYDGATMALYVDGVVVASAAHTGAIATSTDALAIGTKISTTTSSDYFKGLMDDVRVYNRALSASEIATLFT